MYYLSKKLCSKNDKIIWNHQSLSLVADGIDRWDCENPLKSLENFSLNPLTPMSDQDRISPYNCNTISTRQVMRIKKNINLGIIS